MRLLSGAVLQSATRLTIKLMIVAAATVGGGALVSSSVFAALSAQATSSTSVTTGTLSLTQVSAGSGGGIVSGGFTTAVTGMAPSDKVNRFVNLINGGSLAGLSPSLTITAGSTNALSTGSTGLQVNIQNCSVVWTSGSAAGCSGTTTDVLGTNASPVFISTLTTGSALSSLTLTPGANNFLKITLSLPAGNEVTTNGTPPGGSIQGLTTTLAWVFTEQQRAATNTDS